MIHITQLIYLHEGKENIFNEFEAIALPVMTQYGGRLLLRIRPDASSIIDQSIETPYEIHLVSFEDEAGMVAYLQDPTRQQYLHLKDQAVSVSYLYQSEVKHK